MVDKVDPRIQEAANKSQAKQVELQCKLGVFTQALWTGDAEFITRASNDAQDAFQAYMDALASSVAIAKDVHGIG